MRDYIAGRDAGLPPTGRFNAGQKLLFRTQVALGIVQLGTGIPLWFPESFSREVRLWMILLHAAAAVAAILSLVVHVYMAVFVTRGALAAMVHGAVSEAWARHHHGAWAEEQLRRERPSP
jgi:formate dehydrogenase subunit gamma